MRALVQTFIVAMVMAPLGAADDPPAPGSARPNAALSIPGAPGAPGGRGAQDAPAPSGTPSRVATDAAPILPAPAAPAESILEQRLLGRAPGAARRVADAAGPQGWGIAGGEVLRVVLALAVVLGLLLAMRALVRRMGGELPRGGRPSGVVNVLARYPVARGQHLLLLRLGGGRVILVHQGRQAMSTLAEVADHDEVARLVARIEAASGRGAGGASGAPAGRFHALLGRLAAEDDARQVLSPGRAGRGLEGCEVVDLTRRARRGAARRLPA